MCGCDLIPEQIELHACSSTKRIEYQACVKGHIMYIAVETIANFSCTYNFYITPSQIHHYVYTITFKIIPSCSGSPKIIPNLKIIINNLMFVCLSQKDF